MWMTPTRWVGGWFWVCLLRGEGAPPDSGACGFRMPSRDTTTEEPGVGCSPHSWGPAALSPLPSPLALHPHLLLPVTGPETRAPSKNQGTRWRKASRQDSAGRPPEV